MQARFQKTKKASAKYVHFLSKPESNYFLILTCVGFLSGLGLVMVLSASAVHSFEQNGSTFSIFIKQVLFMTLGIGIGYIAMRLPIERWSSITKIALPIAAVTLILPMAPGLGVTVNGNRNWIGLGPITIQPSELAKFFLILWAAMQLRRHHERLERDIQSNPAISLAGGSAIVLGLIMLGKDLGTAAIVAGIIVGMLFVSGIKTSHITFTVAILGVLGAGFTLTHTNRMRRFTAILDPFAPSVYKFAGWQPAHSLMGLASGGLFGVGIGASRQKWANLSEAHTDFIFSVIGEEMGLLGTLLVLFTYAVLIFAIFRVAMNTKELFAKFAVVGIISWFTLQIVINIGTNVSLIPVIGVTLPFISYGGSSLVANYVAIGFVLNVVRRDPELQKVLKANKLARREKA